MNKKILILALMCILSVSVLAGCENDTEVKKSEVKQEKKDDGMQGLEKFRNLKPTPHKGY